jgi:pyruvate/2-oxoglutarate dehydrogenase complex dihydrolipoamide acyltransferase (E2) component
VIYEVELPDLGDDAESEAVVSFWLKEEGETVTEGEDLIELTTDKAAFTLPAPKSGVLLEKRVGEGDEITVGDILCTLEV